MLSLLQQEKIDQVVQNMQETFREGETNNILDKILVFKNKLTERKCQIENLIIKLEELTWQINDTKQEDVSQRLKGLIESLNDTHSILTGQYDGYKKLKALNIARKEIIAFKYALDNLKEIGEDLQSVFFGLPNNQDFQNTDKYISNL